jgi:hypothetical protein
VFYDFADRLLLTAVFLCEPLDLSKQLRRHCLLSRIDNQHPLVAELHGHVRLAWFARHEPDLSEHMPGMNFPILARWAIDTSVGSVKVYRITQRRLLRLRRYLGSPGLTGSGDGKDRRQPRPRGEIKRKRYGAQRDSFRAERVHLFHPLSREADGRAQAAALQFIGDCITHAARISQPAAYRSRDREGAVVLTSALRAIRRCISVRTV